MKYKYKYKDIALPITRITTTGGSLYILIKKADAKKYGLKMSDEAILTLFLLPEKITSREEIRFKEIDFPLIKITTTGDCLAIPVKKKIADAEGLKSGDKVRPVLSKRVQKFPVEQIEKEGEIVSNKQVEQEDEKRYQEINLSETKITKVGNSLAIHLKKDICEKYEIKSGDELIVMLLQQVPPNENTKKAEE